MSCQSTYTTNHEALVGQNLPAAVLGCSWKNFAAQQLAGVPAACSRNINLDEEKSFFKAVFTVSQQPEVFVIPCRSQAAASASVRERDVPSAIAVGVEQNAQTLYEDT